jgi:hypothetical protein
MDYIVGEKELKADSEYDERSIYLKKSSRNTFPVILRMKCDLVIDKMVKCSEIKYGISKGDLQSTVVTIDVCKNNIISFISIGADVWALEGENNVTFSHSVSEYLNLCKKKVFIIHGKDEQQAAQLKHFLKDSGINAVMFSDLKIAGKTVYEAVYTELINVTHAIAIIMPDDVGCLKKEIPTLINEDKTCNKNNRP